jgi:uncharacterized protein (DUF1015 family)
MLRIRPFTAILPKPNKAAQVASVPYDVIDTEEARKLADGNPYSFLHVVRSEIDLPEGADPYDAAVYEKSKENLQKFIDDGVLQRDATPGMFLYRQVMAHRTQIGLVCCCHIDDYANNVILKHEKTRQDKEDDRTRHVLTLNANAEPVFLTFLARQEIKTLMDSDTSDRPLFHFNAEDGVTHTVWPVKDASAYVRAFAGIDRAYIADGHHRSASAARAGAERRAANPNHTGEEEYNWFMTVLFPHDHLTILPYNRVVKDLAGKDEAAVLDAIAHEGMLHRASGEKLPKSPGTVCVYLRGEWHTLTFEPSSIDRNDPIKSLDVSLLQDRILEPILGIRDPRTDKRIDFVGGIRGTDELERRVQSGEAAISFSLYPTTIEQLMAVSDAGLVMPPKSTWFEPKLRSGLFVHMLDEVPVPSATH